MPGRVGLRPSRADPSNYQQVAGPYIFLPFFVLVGASLDLKTFAASLGFAAILAIARMLCIFLGTAVPGHFMGQVSSVRNL